MIDPAEYLLVREFVAQGETYDYILAHASEFEALGMQDDVAYAAEVIERRARRFDGDLAPMYGSSNLPYRIGRTVGLRSARANVESSELRADRSLAERLWPQLRSAADSSATARQAFARAKQEVEMVEAEAVDGEDAEENADALHALRWDLMFGITTMTFWTGVADGLAMGSLESTSPGELLVGAAEARTALLDPTVGASGLEMWAQEYRWAAENAIADPATLWAAAILWCRAGTAEDLLFENARAIFREHYVRIYRPGDDPIVVAERVRQELGDAARQSAASREARDDQSGEAVARATGVCSGLSDLMSVARFAQRRNQRPEPRQRA